MTFNSAAKTLTLMKLKAMYFFNCILILNESFYLIKNDTFWYLLGKEKTEGFIMSVQIRDSNSLVEFNEEKLALIKSMFAKDATDMEFDLFIAIAHRLQLDPVLKQIHFVKFSGKMSIIVSIDGYRLIADRTGKYMPGSESTFTYDKEGRLFSASSFVKKLGPDGQWHEFGGMAIRSEYDTGINQWKKGPHYMLAKCAESLALRKGWPAEYIGTHSEEEMDKSIIDVGVDKRSGEVLKAIDVSPISNEDAKKIQELIGDDDEYSSRILSHYKIDSFTKLPQSQFVLVLEKIKKRNEEKLREEMSNRAEA